ncbi:esterase-like activity of phytase family protein [Albimonas sp. CAU 1670]|uniref:esterase-like activity of phytase family protein n=1 Tax=Albimonas sp. CAU 1670 TaxID=3032599 RepID=UPI0023DCDDDA|nr:esterase-like activity of phytase family protein [Albimonas sp. CAU 1670]MDF2231412.1 esterase-like activity of phytase family protein [Albimonas sp. CAU 1670]
MRTEPGRPTRARLLRAVAPALALALAACGPPPAPAGEAAPPAPLLLQAQPFPAALPAGARLRLLSAIELRGDRADFGGLSALEVDPRGERFVALTDQGVWVEGRIRRAGGRLSEASEATFAPMLSGDVRPPLRMRDSEGLAILSPDLDGPRYVGFERRKRVERMEGPGAEGAIVAEPREWLIPTPNAGPEALAVAPDGRVLAVMETPFSAGADFTAAWIDPRDAGSGAYAETTVPRLLDMEATGADFDDRGRLWLLMRRFSKLGGFSFAIARFRPEGDGFADGEVMLEMPAGPGSDNAEGIAAWTDPLGRTRLLVVTDDNLNLLQRTVLYEFEVPPDD